MDFQELWEQVQERFEALLEQSRDWPDLVKDYFTSLSRLEQYGWAGFAAGFLLFIAGFIIW